MRKRVNGITKNKGAVYKGAVVLSTIFIFGVSMKVVYSNSKFDIKFKYLGEEFDPQTNIFNQENNPKWFFNNAARSEVKLEVDFSEYYRIATVSYTHLDVYKRHEVAKQAEKLIKSEYYPVIRKLLEKLEE